MAVEDGAAPKEEGGGGGQEEEESEEEAVKDPSNLYAAPPVCLSLSLCMSLECTCGAPLCVFFVGLSVRCIFAPPPLFSVPRRHAKLQKVAKMLSARVSARVCRADAGCRVDEATRNVDWPCFICKLRHVSCAQHAVQGGQDA